MKERALSSHSLTPLLPEVENEPHGFIPPLTSPIKRQSDKLYKTVVQVEDNIKVMTKIKTELLQVDSEGHRKNFLAECTCTSTIRERGRFNETNCEAHKFTLRNSKPHPYMLNSLNATSYHSSTKTLATSQSQPVLSTVLVSPIRSITSSTPTYSPADTPTKKSKRRRGSVSSKKPPNNSNGSHNVHTIQTPVPLVSIPSVSSVRSPINPIQKPQLVSSTPIRSDENYVSIQQSLHHPLGDIVIDNPFVLEQRKVLDMLEKYNKLINLHTDPPHDMAIIYARRSTLLAALEKYELSLKDAEKVIELEPMSTIGFFRKGYALSGLQRYADATNAFQQGLAFDVHSRQLRHALNNTLVRMRHPVL